MSFWFVVLTSVDSKFWIIRSNLVIPNFVPYALMYFDSWWAKTFLYHENNVCHVWGNDMMIVTITKHDIISTRKYIKKIIVKTGIYWVLSETINIIYWLTCVPFLCLLVCRVVFHKVGGLVVWTKTNCTLCYSKCH